MQCLILIELARLQWRISRVLLQLEVGKNSLISERILETIGFDPGSFIWRPGGEKMQKRHTKICKWENSEKNDC